MKHNQEKHSLFFLLFFFWNGVTAPSAGSHWDVQQNQKSGFSWFISQFSVENVMTERQNYSHTCTHAHLHMLDYQQLYLQVWGRMFTRYWISAVLPLVTVHRHTGSLAWHWNMTHHNCCMLMYIDDTPEAPLTFAYVHWRNGSSSWRRINWYCSAHLICFLHSLLFQWFWSKGTVFISSLFSGESFLLPPHFWIWLFRNKRKVLEQNCELIWRF